MNKLIFLIITILILKANGSLKLKSTDVCKFSKRSQQNNKYFESIKCQEHFSFKCAADHCSLNKTTCENFLKIVQITHSLSNVLFSRKKVDELKQLIKRLKDCPSSKLEPTRNICVNDQTCFIQQKFKLRILKQNFKKKTICPCEGHYSYNCGKSYCTAGKAECVQLLSERENIVKNIEDCKNGNKVFYENFIY